MIAFQKLLIAGCAFALAGCESQQSGAFFTAPVASVPASVSIGGDTTAASVKLATDRLKAVGFKTSVQAASGKIRTQGSSNAAVNCGTIRQNAFGNSSIFPGNSDVAVLYQSEKPPVFFIREVSVRSAANILVNGGSATVNEAHDVTITWKNANKQVVLRETKLVKPGTVVRFSDNIGCTASGAIGNVIEN